jgi:septum formation protein
MRLILASASPRRADLLTAAGLSFDVLAVDADERARDAESPDAYVRRLAAEKSAKALDRLMPCASTHDHGICRSPRGDDIVIGADTSVVVEGAILGKPVDDDDARRMLSRLAGRRHEVLTGVSLRTAAREVSSVDSTAVFFAPMSTAEIAWYVQTGEGRDKAGGYAIQGAASRFIWRIEGSYSNVVGLPIALLYNLLREFEDGSGSVAMKQGSGYP